MPSPSGLNTEGVLDIQLSKWGSKGVLDHKIPSATAAPSKLTLVAYFRTSVLTADYTLQQFLLKLVLYEHSFQLSVLFCK